MANQSLEAELIRTLREIQRLQTQARKFRRQLKKNQQDLRFERRKLKALQGELEQRRPDVAPMRVFAGAAGMRPAARVLGEDTGWGAAVPAEPLLDGKETK